MLNRITPVAASAFLRTLIDSPFEVFARWLHQSSVRRWLFFAVISLTTFTLFYYLRTTMPAPFKSPFERNFGSRFVDHLHFVMLFWIGAGLFFELLELSPRLKHWALIAVSLASFWIWDLSFEWVFYERTEGFAFWLCCAISLIPMCILLSSRMRDRIQAWQIVLLSVGLGFLLAFIDEQQIISLGNWPLSPHRTMMIALYFQAEFSFISMPALDVRRLLEFMISPAQLMTPIPTRSQSLKNAPDRLQTQLKGLRDILYGYSCLMIWFHLPEKYAHVDSIYFIGLVKYFKYYLISNAAIGIPVGMLRWLGWNLPNHYDLPLLAVNPAERWRKWNTYFYNWFHHLVFLPVFKKTGSVFLAVLVVFAMTAYIHVGTPIFYFLLNWNEKTGIFIKDTFIFFGLHAVIVYGALKFPEVFGKNYEFRSWFGLILTWMLMVLIHTFAPL